MKTKPKTDNTIRREAEVAIDKLAKALDANDPSNQEGVNQLMDLAREAQYHASEVEFLARKGYAIMRRAATKITLPANTAMSLADFQKEVKRQKAEQLAPMKKIIDADYRLTDELFAIANRISGRLAMAFNNWGLEPLN